MNASKQLKDIERIRKFAYLKTPLFSWTVENDNGGSFTNSGMLKSEKACIKHVTAHVRHLLHYGPLPMTIYSVDGQGNETLVATMEVA